MSAPAWMGVTVDHLYPDCPNRLTAEGTLREVGWWRQCLDEVDPFGEFICGRCVNRYRKRQP